MKLEQRSPRGASTGLAERIQGLEQQMRSLAVEILRLPEGGVQWAEAGAHVAQLKQRLARKAAEEKTAWALDGDENGETAIYAETELPGEAALLRDLIRLVPDGTDRKFDTLVRAIEELRRENPREKFIVFTQYRETLEYLREELAKVYGADWIVTIKGGPLGDKIAAVEAFWELGGAQFLISTSAGGEGINLQCARVLFNYDLPWNPMAVEQRIGRIHRYGQQDTAQVYNLVAQDTVEERIYTLLEEKLLEVARTIGKVDSVTGQPSEDFRSEILGCLGSSPSYQDLFKKALVDRDYHRTEREMAEAMERARRASEALRSLAQNLEGFRLTDYTVLRGDYTLEDLREFCATALPRLGGAMLPDGELYRVETPACLHGRAGVERSYQNVTFDRQLAMRRKQARLLGLGHPLLDALIAELQGPSIPGALSALQIEDASQPVVRVHCVARLTYEDGRSRRIMRVADLGSDGSWTAVKESDDSLTLRKLIMAVPSARPREGQLIADAFIPSFQAALSVWESQLRAEEASLQTVRIILAGVAVLRSGDVADTSRTRAGD